MDFVGQNIIRKLDNVKYNKYYSYIYDSDDNRTFDLDDKNEILTSNDFDFELRGISLQYKKYIWFR